MGLDMYLRGRKFHTPNEKRREDGFEVKETILELAYWRKHPDLHGYIVQNFANGVDDCKPIELDEEKLVQTIKAVVNEKLPHTEGFFFGQSSPEDKIDTLEQLGNALKWLKADDNESIRGVHYRASW